MTAQEISDKYDIPISILEKMQEDSKTGSKIRVMNYRFDKGRYIKVIFENGVLRYELNGFERFQNFYPK